MRVRITQLDGKLPNLALMRLAHWHRSRGDEVVYTRRANYNGDAFDGEGTYDRVYGSAIFTTSAPAVARFKRDFPGAILGGTGTDSPLTIEQIVGGSWETPDYSDHPNYSPSLGFTQRGCRQSCKFCVVPAKEGKPRSTNTIADIWRGEGHPRHIHLLDNDFCGQPEWRARLDEIRAGHFSVCFNQGINVRALDPRVAPGAAQALADALVVRKGKRVEYLYRDDQFARPRLYTAWDNLKDEDVFFRGVEALEQAGIPPKHLMAYMLIGFDKSETMDRIMYRFKRMDALGILPYPMVWDRKRRDLKDFQKWVVTGVYRAGIPFEEFSSSLKKSREVEKQRQRREAAAKSPTFFDLHVS